MTLPFPFTASCTSCSQEQDSAPEIIDKKITFGRGDGYLATSLCAYQGNDVTLSSHKNNPMIGKSKMVQRIREDAVFFLHVMVLALITLCVTLCEVDALLSASI